MALVWHTYSTTPGSTVETHRGPIAFLIPTVSSPVIAVHSSIASGIPTGDVPALSRDRRTRREGSIVGPPGGTFDEDFVGSTPPRASFSAVYGQSEEEEEGGGGGRRRRRGRRRVLVAEASPFPPRAPPRAVVQPRRRTIGERPARRARVARVLAAISPRASRRGRRASLVGSWTRWARPPSRPRASSTWTTSPTRACASAARATMGGAPISLESAPIRIRAANQNAASGRFREDRYWPATLETTETEKSYEENALSAPRSLVDSRPPRSVCAFQPISERPNIFAERGKNRRFLCRDG